MIIPTAEPFIYPGGSIGVLLVHGFTGTPKEMREMGGYLHKQGFSVVGIRLAGHATNPNDMLRVRWEDWLASVEDGYHLLKDISDQIIIAGLSMGGVLSLLFSSKFAVAGVIAMSTPYDLPPDPRRKLLPLIYPILKNIPKDAPDWDDPTVDQGHISYPAYPTKAIIELSILIKEMQDALKRIRIPALLMHSENDGGVPIENMFAIYTNLGSKNKKMLTLGQSGHVIVRDSEKDKVFSEAVSFIRINCGSTV